MSNIPPKTSFVALSEALYWIAFEDYLNADINWANNTAAQNKLLSALVGLLDKACMGLIVLRGKFLPDISSDHKLINTEQIPAVHLHDFQWFDSTCNGLRRGQPPRILWYAQIYGAGARKSFRSTMPDGLNEGHYQDVKVDRTMLERHFPRTVIRAISTAGAEHACETWLENQFQSGVQMSKSEFRAQAMSQIPNLGKNGFDRAWSRIAPKYQRNLAGAKRKSTQ